MNFNRRERARRCRSDFREGNGGLPEATQETPGVTVGESTVAGRWRGRPGMGKVFLVDRPGAADALCIGITARGATRIKLR